nr:hypothetical protein [Candidatus Njordarchaeum guaymaensis]
MRGKGLVLTVAHLLYDAATIDEFVSIEEITDFLEEPQQEVTSTMQVLHNIMVAVTEQEYLEELRKVIAKLEKHDYRSGNCRQISVSGPRGRARYTLNPIVFSLIEKGIVSTPIYEALRIVVSQLLSQWEESAAKGMLTEFTSKLSADHKEGLATELCRRVALKDGCELTEEEMNRLKRLPREVDQFKMIYTSKFLKSYNIGQKLGITITPSDVISYISVQLRRGEIPG